MTGKVPLSLAPTLEAIYYDGSDLEPALGSHCACR